MNTNWNDPNFQGFGGRQSPFGKRPPRPKKEHKAIGTPLSRTLINLAVTLIFAAVLKPAVRGVTDWNIDNKMRCRAEPAVNSKQ